MARRTTFFERAMKDANKNYLDDMVSETMKLRGPKQSPLIGALKAYAPPMAKMGLVGGLATGLMEPESTVSQEEEMAQLANAYALADKERKAQEYSQYLMGLAAQDEAMSEAALLQDNADSEAVKALAEKQRRGMGMRSLDKQVGSIADRQLQRNKAREAAKEPWEIEADMYEKAALGLADAVGKVRKK